MPQPRHELQARRKAAGYSQETFAHALEVASSSVGRWENGIGTPLDRYRRPMAELLGVTLAELEHMIGMNSPAALHGHAVPPWLNHYASLEQGAAKLQTVEPLAIPGLLQTQEYAAAVMRAYFLPVSDDGVTERVNARMARQRVLDRKPEPLELVCVIYEPVLHQMMGGREVMAGQLRHLCKMAAGPTVELRVVPLGKTEIQSALFGPFWLFTSAGATSPFIVCTEDIGGLNYLDRPNLIATYVLLFEYLVNSALSATQSTELIRATAEDYQ